MQKRERKADGAVDTRFAAMHLINDPQALAELLFESFKSDTCRDDTKMLVILVMCRIIGMHQLIMLNVYPFFAALHSTESVRGTCSFYRDSHDELSRQR